MKATLIYDIFKTSRAGEFCLTSEHGAHFFKIQETKTLIFNKPQYTFSEITESY